jgi:hypothetical protein
MATAQPSPEKDKKLKDPWLKDLRMIFHSKADVKCKMVKW